jgi:serine/threonine protein kinase
LLYARGYLFCAVWCAFGEGQFVDATLDQFVRELTHSGLMTATEIAAFQQTLPAECQPTDATALAQRLIEAHRLTEYQVSAIIEGRSADLLFGEYRILDRIGEGGMGIVLKAEHQLTRRVVAVKVLAAGAMRAPNIVQRFYRELQTAARLNHPNIVAAYDAGQFKGNHYLVMEFVDGQSLSDLVHQRGPLPLGETLGYLIQAARGLQYAHEQGIVHRDIKPSNLLVDRQGVVKVLDMGLARLIDTKDASHVESLTRTGLVMGTCDYMAPEQAVDSHRADHRADIYSLGCTLYRLLTGTVPFPADNLMAALLAHREARVPVLRHIRPDLPPRLDTVFRRMLAKRPGDRYQSMTEVVAALQDVLRQPRPHGVWFRRWMGALRRWFAIHPGGPSPSRLTPLPKADLERTISFHSDRGIDAPLQ